MDGYIYSDYSPSRRSSFLRQPHPHNIPSFPKTCTALLFKNNDGDESKIDLKEVNTKLVSINKRIKSNTDKHNEFLKELGLPLI